MYDLSAQEEDRQSIGENNLYPKRITSRKLLWISVSREPQAVRAGLVVSQYNDID